MDIVASCAFGLESVVKKETERLGIREAAAGNGLVVISGGHREVCLLNLRLRTAEHVYIRLAWFEATSFDQLFEGIRAIPWGDLLPRDAKTHVHGKSLKSGLSSVPDCQSVAKKAIVEAMKQKHGYTWLPESGTTFDIHVNLEGDRVSVLLDTTGMGLHKRGYRPLATEAPLRETLAAALIILSGWRPSKPFLDPLCGSGTLPIEAAMIGRRIAPGLKRSFAAEAWGTAAEKAIWREARAEAAAEAQAEARGQAGQAGKIALDIRGSDINPRVLETARRHAQMAGVADSVVFSRRSLAETAAATALEPGGGLFANPPYGERMEDDREARRILRELARFGSDHPTWGLFVITPDKDFEKYGNGPADRKRKLYNGRLECVYYQYFGTPAGGVSPPPRKVPAGKLHQSRNKGRRRTI